MSRPVRTTGSNAVILGSAGGPCLTATRSAPANVVVGDRLHVVDCGNGVARQLARAGLQLRDLRSVFITHHHSDHMADYGALLLLAWASGLVQPVEVYGPPPVTGMTASAMELYMADIDIRIVDEGRPDLRTMVEPTDLIEPGIVYEDDDVRVTAALVDHPPVVPAFAYRFDCADRSYVFSGDTAPSDAVVDLARGADVFIQEVMYLPDTEHLSRNGNVPTRLTAQRRSHTGVDDVGALAEEAGVGTLVLSHFSPAENSITENEWVQRASRGFNGEVLPAQDLMRI